MKRWIRASEIGTYLYCRRAWWYQQQGYASENRAQLEAGQAFHRHHGRLVWQSHLLRLLGTTLLLLSLMLLAAYCTARLL